MPPQNLIQNHKISPREMYGQGLPLPWSLALVALPLISSQLLALVALFPHPSCSPWSLCLSSPPKIFIADFQRYFLQNRKHFQATSPTSLE